MAERTGKCTRFGNCSMADTGAEVRIPDGSEPVCPECGKALLVQQQGKGSAKLIAGVVGLLVVAAAGYVGMKFMGSKPVPAVTPVMPAADQLVTVPVAVTPPPPPAAAPAYEGMVKVADFWIDKTEVSIGEFKEVFPGYQAPTGFTDDLPVVDVSWEEADRFAAKRGKRLCTEAQWLFALGELRDLSAANLGGTTMDLPRPVGDERDRNAQGLLNMAGNVSEWVDTGTDEAAFIGGYWYWSKEGRPVSELKTVHRLGTKKNHHHYIGLRGCRDALPTANRGE